MGRTCQGFTEEQFAELKSELEKPEHRQNGNYVTFWVMLSLGGRISEILALTWGDLWDSAKSEPRKFVSREKKKSRKKEDVITGFLCDEAREAVREWRQICAKRRKLRNCHFVFTKGGRLKPTDRRYVWATFKKIYEQLGFETGNHFTFALHSVRKTFCQMNDDYWYEYYLSRNPGDNKKAVEFAEQQVQKLLGHADVATTRKYKRRADEDPLDSVRKVFN
jgi:integrase